MPYEQIVKTETDDKSVGGGGFTTDGGGGETTGGDDFTYHTVTSTTTFGEDDVGDSDIIVFDIPADVNLSSTSSDNKSILFSINISGAVTQPVSNIPVFIEVSHDGANWSEHGDSLTAEKLEILADLTVDTTGVQIFSYNTQNQVFPRIRFGFNSGSVNLAGMIFTIGFTYVDTWTDPAKFRAWRRKQGE